MHESSFPLHHRVDYNASSRLGPAPHVKVKNQQPRTIELLVDDKRRFGSKATVTRSHQAKVITLGHLDPQLFLVWIGAGALNQEGLTSIVRNDRYAFIKGSYADVPLCAVSFVDRAAQSSPSEPGDDAPIHSKDVLNTTLTQTLDNDLAGAHEVAFKDLSGSGN